MGIDLLTFPELAVCGYPPEDLLLKPQFVTENLRTIKKIEKHASGLTVVVGFVDAQSDIYNAAAIIHDGKLSGIYHEIYLPNYGVFDENRYFQAGQDCPVYTVAGTGVGVNICEDIWYEAGPATIQAYSGAEVIVNISASPYHFGRLKFRERMLATSAADNVVIVAYNNLVGGQDELVFDGGSMVLDERGQLITKGKQFEEDLIVADLDVEAVFRTRLRDPRWRKEAYQLGRQRQVVKVALSEAPVAAPKPELAKAQAQSLEPAEEVYRALLLGTGDYVLKNGLAKVVIGLSGGIDSSLVADIAVAALGADNVVGVAMPSAYSSPSSLRDAKLLARNLGIRLLSIPINRIFQAYLKTLAEPLKEAEPDVTEENIQARIRGNLLMALSNKFGWLVLTAGNKSEYKRRQAPPGVKITPRAFGRDRRLPITNRFRG